MMQLEKKIIKKRESIKLTAGYKIYVVKVW